MAHPPSIGTSTVGVAAPILSITDGHPTTLSTQVAEFFGKRHDNVMQAITGLRSQLDGNHLLNFQEVTTEYQNGKGGTQTAPAYRLTRDGFTLLAMGFTGKKALAFKLAYIEAFNRMERELSGGQPTPFAQHLPPAVEKAITDKAFQVGAQANQLAAANLRHMVANLPPEVAIQKIESTPFADAIGTPSEELQQAYAHAATAVNALGHLLLSLDKMQGCDSAKNIAAAASGATKNIAFKKGVAP